MKKRIFLKLMMATLILSASMAAVGCGVIPAAYRGQFKDPKNGVSLDLQSSEGAFRAGEGETAREIKAKAADLKYEDIAKGEPGIYVSTNPTSAKTLEVYWVNPDKATRQTAGDLVWFESEVIYTLLDLKKEEGVNEIELLHCMKGTILLDAPTKRWQIGCPANTDTYRLSRVSEKEKGSEEHPRD